MTDNTEKLIESIAAKADISEDKVRERVEQQVEDMKANQTSALSEEKLKRHAISIVKNDLLNITGGGGFGGRDAEELPILTLGYQYKEGDYFVTDDDAILGLGIINPPDDPAGVAIFLIDSGHGVDLEHAGECFRPLNTVRGYVSRRQVGGRDGEPSLKKGGNPTYLVNSTSQSKFEQVSPDEVDESDPISELPSDREAKRDMIHEHFITEEDWVTLQSYAEHVTTKNQNGYELAFGIDVKRIRGEVVDVYSNDNGFGVMTLMDDTAFGEEDVPEELISDRMRTPGLQVFGMPPDLLEYGENSVLDVYGYIEQTDEGQYRMQGMGIIPIVEFERQHGHAKSSNNSDDDHEEDTI